MNCTGTVGRSSRAEQKLLFVVRAACTTRITDAADCKTLPDRC